MNPPSYNVLFLCTGNSARSIIAECLLNRIGAGDFKAYSAGSDPKGEVHPLALKLLQQQNYDVSELRSKNWSEFSAGKVPPLDFVFTLCDSAAAESCPIWPGQPVSAHWGLPDPAAAQGTQTEREQAFAEALSLLTHRLQAFTRLPISSLDGPGLQYQVEQIGSSRGR